MFRNKLLLLHKKGYTKKMLFETLKADPELLVIDENIANKYAKQLNCNFVTIFDDNFPKKLINNKTEVWLIYYCGNISLLNTNSVMITGTRHPSVYGLVATKDIVKSYQGENIITNLSYGIDKQAILCSIENENQIICNLASGINNIYPKNLNNIVDYLKLNNLVISVFPVNEKASPTNFITRNEMSALLCNKIIVVEAEIDSEIMHIVDYGLAYYKEIYALPGSIYNEKSQGTNQLIQEGAQIVTIKSN